MPRRISGMWAQGHLAQLVGTSAVSFGRYLNGLGYPNLQMMQKFEVVFGWPVVDQVQLVPYYWTWPDHHKEGGEDGPLDMRYALKLYQVTREWSQANPRTVRADEIRQHPSIPHNRRMGSRIDM